VATDTITVPASAPTVPVSSPSPPSSQPTPNPATDETTCYTDEDATEFARAFADDAWSYFCGYIDGYILYSYEPIFNLRGPGSLGGDPNLYTFISVSLKQNSNCAFTMDQLTCTNIFNNILYGCDDLEGTPGYESDSLYTGGGIMEDNCAIWTIYGQYGDNSGLFCWPTPDSSNFCYTQGFPDGEPTCTGPVCLG
jgi:hypothetical protein